MSLPGNPHQDPDILYRLRVKNKYSQQKAGNILSVSISTISKWENRLNIDIQRKENDDSSNAGLSGKPHTDTTVLERMIENEYTTKEIADILEVHLSTIDYHLRTKGIKKSGIPRKDMIEELNRVADNADCIPTTRIFDDKSNIGYLTVLCEFGSWNDALKAAELEVNLTRKASQMTDDELREFIQTTIDNNPEATGWKRFNQITGCSVDTIIRRIDTSWRSLLEDMGFNPTSYQSLETRELEAELLTVAEKIGHSPSRSEFDKHARWSADVYCDRYGSWNKAKESVGLSTEPSGREFSDKRLQTPEWLQKHYTEQQMSIPEIANRVGCSDSAVSRALHRNDVSVRGGRFTVYSDVLDEPVDSPAERTFAKALKKHNIIDKATYHPGPVRNGNLRWDPDFKVGNWYIECKRGCWGQLYSQAEAMKATQQPILLFGIEQDKRELPHDMYIKYELNEVPDLSDFIDRV